MLTTPVYGLPYPELTDAPNGAAQLQQLAETLEAVLQPIEAAVFVPKIIMGRVVVPTSTGPFDVFCGFRPQRIEIVTARGSDTSPSSWSESGATQYAEGHGGLDTNGNLIQHLHAIYADPTSAFHRTRVDRIGGYLFGSTTLLAVAELTAFTDSGFTLNQTVASTLLGNEEYHWTAWQGS